MEQESAEVEWNWIKEGVYQSSGLMLLYLTQLCVAHSGYSISFIFVLS